MHPLADLAKELSGRRVLITGGLGFLGSSLARILLDAGSYVRVLDALVPGHGGFRSNLADVEGRVEVTIGDVRDRALVSRLLKGQEVVFSLAGQTSHIDSMHDPFTDLEHNCRGPLTLLEMCRRVNPDVKVVFAGTRQVYGRPAYLPVDEHHPLSPVDVNGVHKGAAEMYHLLHHQVYGLRVSVLRLTNCYGPRMNVRDARQTFLGLWIRRLLTGEVIEIYGDGQQRRDFTYLDDALRAFLLAATREEADGEVFNLGGRQVISLADLAELLIALNGGGEAKLVPFPADHSQIDIGDYHGDFRKIEATLGWQPWVELEAGLRRTLDYYRRKDHQYWKSTG